MNKGESHLRGWRDVLGRLGTLLAGFGGGGSSGLGAVREVLAPAPLQHAIEGRGGASLMIQLDALDVAVTLAW